MQNPEMMRSAMQMLGGGGSDVAGAGGLGRGGGGGAFNPFDMGGLAGMGQQQQQQQERDTRPPEVRYEEQLRQLNDMGFYEFDRNVQALRRSGGSVQGAVEYLLQGL